MGPWGFSPFALWGFARGERERRSGLDGRAGRGDGDEEDRGEGKAR